VKVSSCKKLKATDSLLYTQAEPWLKRAKWRGFKGRYGCIIGFTKDVDYDIEFIGGINSIFLVEGYFYATPRSWNRLCTIITFSDWPIESLHHQHQAGGDSRGEGSLLGRFSKLYGW
jgi:hypothetical protein